MPKLVTIATGLSVQNAYLVRAELEGSGIYCFLANEHLLGTTSLLAFAGNGVEVRVMEDNVPRAMEVLTGKEFDGAAKPDAVPKAEQRCPKCGNAEFKRKRVGFLRVLLASLLGAGRVSLPRDRKICTRCGHEWQ